MAKISKKMKAERRGRKKIAKLLRLMDFQDDPTGALETMLLRRLRHIEERNKNPSSSKTIRKITFKFGTKAAPLKTTSSVVSGNPSCSKMTINCYGDHPSFEKNHSEMLKQKSNSGDEKLPSSSSSSENLNFPSGDENNNINNGNHMEMKDFIKSIGGSEAELLIQKTLTVTDCNKNQCRLLIPAMQVKNPGFLTINEKRKLEMKECISVDVFDPQRRKWTLNLAQWNMNNANYALRTKWTDLRVANGFKENMTIRILSFRVHEKLCFAVERLD